ncbi:MAG: hypothetical protein RL172_1647, partial [Bacteroidota bacterium]
LAAMITTFSLTVFAWIFFRAESVGAAITYIKNMFTKGLFQMPDERAFIGTTTNPFFAIFLIAIFMLIEWMGREQQYALAKLGLRWYKPVRWAFYYVLIIAVFLFMGKEQQFIYFQF